MKISVFGLGYVGCVSAAAWPPAGHEVIGVDVNPVKVDLITGGQAPGRRGADRRAHRRGRAIRSAARHHRRPPRRSRDDRDLADLRGHAVGAERQPVHRRTWSGSPSRSAQALRRASRRHTVVFRSTMLPGTCLDLLVPILEKASGKTAGVDFGVAVNPEFLREGTSVRDFFDPPKTVIGELDPASGDVVAALYDGLPGEVFRVPIPVAEMTKYADNSFHALKIGFANELGAICQALGVDSHAGDGRLPGRPQAEHQPGLPAARLRLRRLVPAQGPARPGLRGPPGRRLGADPRARPAVQRGASAPRVRAGRPRPASAGSACSACPSSPAPTTCARARSSSWPSGSSARATTCGSTTPTCRLSRLIGANREYIEMPPAAPRRAAAATPSRRCSTHAEVCVVGMQGPGSARRARRPGATADRTVVDLVRLPDARGRAGPTRATSASAGDLPCPEH